MDKTVISNIAKDLGILELICEKDNNFRSYTGDGKLAILTEFAQKLQEQTKSHVLEPLTFYGVHTNTDLTEGRGTEYISRFCVSKTTANRLAKKAYVMGSDAPVEVVNAFKIDGRIFVSGGWIDHPSKEDREGDLKLEQQRIAKEAKDAALEKAKSLGMTDADIKALMGV